MRVIKVFLLGLIFGWFMRWIIDRIYYEDDFKRIADENALLKERVHSYETRSVQRVSPIPQPDQRPAPAPVTTAANKSSSRKDDLKKIKGIGPVMEKKLNAAGINTFEQFSRLTTQDIQNILGISKRVVQSADNLITQARQLAQKKTKR